MQEILNTIYGYIAEYGLKVVGAIGMSISI